MPRHLFIHSQNETHVKPLVKLFRMLGCALVLCSLAWTQTPAEQLFRQAHAAERAGEIARAYLLYAQAAAADPANLSYWERAQALRPVASLLNASPPQSSGPAKAPEIDPTLFGTVTENDLDLARKPLPPPELKSVPGRRDYDLTGDSKSLWEQVSATLQLKVMFDPAYQPTRPFRFQLTAADYRDTLRGLEAATDSFLTPVSDRLILIANDTTQKRTEFERTAAIVIPFTETDSVQELQEIATSVRGILDTQRLMVDTTRRLILIRDRVTKVRLAQKLFEDLMRPKPQVAIEVEILTTSSSSSLSYGVSLQTAFPLVSFSTKPNLLHSIPSGFTNFAGIGGGASLLGFGIASARIFASMAKGNSESILRSEVVALDGQPSTLHIGDKYPLVTNTYIGNTSGGGQVFTPPPTFNFEDLGLVLKVTPRIHGPDEVSLDIDAEFKLLGSSTIDGIPVIASKKYESKVRVSTGEWAILAGLMTASEARTITGLPILSLIPLFRSNSINRDSGETLIVLKPHILVLPPTETATWKAWCGSETRLPSEM